MRKGNKKEIERKKEKNKERKKGKQEPRNIYVT